MSDMFEHYEKEYLSYTSAAARNIEQVAPLAGGERSAMVESIEKDLGSALEIVDQMGLEARTMQGSLKSQLQMQVKDYKAEISELKSRLKKARAVLPNKTAEKEELLSGASSSEMRTAEDQRSRLLQTTEKLESSTQKLKQAQEVALETIEIGTSTLSELDEQRETINKAHSRLKTASAGLDYSKKLLRGMGRRAIMNKIIMVVIILVLAGLILLIIWMQFFSSSDKPHKGDSKGRSLEVVGHSHLSDPHGAMSGRRLLFQ